VEIARDRVPGGRFDAGDIQSLPYEDGTFDRVCAFNSLQFVPKPSATLAEVRRVTKLGGSIYLLVWGRAEHTDLVAVMQALHPLTPPRPPDGAGPFALSAPGLLEDLATECGFIPIEAGYLDVPYEYPDQATMLRAQCSSGPAVLATRTSGAAKVRDAITSALSPRRSNTGGYRIQTEYRYVTANAQ
jgi:SAM-dependent methyltransferase